MIHRVEDSIVRALHALAGSLLALAAFTCSAQAGMVVEKGTGRPLGGVVIVREALGARGFVVQPGTACVHSDFGTSGPDGSFRIWSFNPFDKSYVIAAYKAGYHMDRKASDNDRIVMEPHASDRALRLRQILDLGLPGSCGDETNRTLVEPVFLPWYREAAKDVTTYQEFTRVDGILFLAEELTMGKDVARERSLDRERAWRRGKR